VSTVFPPGQAFAPAMVVAAPKQKAPVKDARRALGDGSMIAALAGCFALMTALTWRKWGMPEIDAGAELTTADLVKHGALAYRDVRYYYGPLGLYSLALSFKLFGTSFTTAYGFGLMQAAAILGVFYALARQWLAPLSAGLATVVLLAIGFSGTAFNFVLPHTNSATFGILCLLLTLLALARERIFAAGLAAGLVGLTRPEFLAVVLAALGAFLIARWRTEGRAKALGAAALMGVPAVVIPVAVLGWFAARTGLSTLLGDNLWPARFVHMGARTESGWMPLSAAGLFGLFARAALYGGTLVALVLSAERWRRREAGRPLALWPVGLALLLFSLGDGLLRASGLFAGERMAIELEARHLILGMSWLPALGLATLALAAIALLRRSPPLLGRSWPADMALVVAAALLGLRAYNAFTADGSYAPYYAAPLVLLLGILHTRLAERRPQARVAAIGMLGLVAAGLATYSLGALYRHITTPVHTARGTFMSTAASAPALQATVSYIERTTRPGEPIFAAPVDGGLYFMTNRPPALHELSLLPGLLASRAEQIGAIARLRQKRVSLAVIAARNFSSFGTPTFGVDYDRLLGDYLRQSSVAVSTIGDLRLPVGGTNPSKGFTIHRLS